MVDHVDDVIDGVDGYGVGSLGGIARNGKGDSAAGAVNDGESAYGVGDVNLVVDRVDRKTVRETTDVNGLLERLGVKRRERKQQRGGEQPREAREESRELGRREESPIEFKGRGAICTISTALLGTSWKSPEQNMRIANLPPEREQVVARYR